MTAFISSVIPLVVLISQLIFVLIFIALVFGSSVGTKIIGFLAKHAVSLSLLAVLAAVTGSLFYSNIVGYAPCELCWWQRIFIYPQVVLFALALVYRSREIFKYAWYLSLGALFISFYQAYVQAGGASILPCTAVGSACAKVFVNAFGYLTIPLMSVTVCACLLLFAWSVFHHEKNDRHA